VVNFPIFPVLISIVMKLISWNVNGVRAVAKKGFAEQVKVWNADFICLQETKAQDDEVRQALLISRTIRSFLLQQCVRDTPALVS
jgi:exonuclease III